MVHWIAAHADLIDAVGIDALMAMSVWIIFASGRVSLGNAAFSAISAVVTLYLASAAHWPAGWALAAAVAATAAIGYVTSIPLARLGRTQFAVATLLLGAAVSSLISRAAPMHVTGKMGIPTVGIYVGLAVSVLAVWRFMQTRDGRALAAIAQDERAASTVGIDPARLRHISFVAGAAVAGLAGALLILQHGAFRAEDFGFDRNVAALAAVVVGGVGTFLGPIIGTAVLGALTIVAPSLSVPPSG